MAFGIDTNKMVDRAVEKLGPHIERALALFNTQTAELDASVDAMTTAVEGLRSEQVRTNRKLDALIAQGRAKPQG